MKLKKGDKVQVISGKHKGKGGAIERVFSEDQKILVSGVNLVKKHVKPGREAKEGGIISIEKPINSSTLMLVCPKCSKPSKIEFKITDGKKYRICKNCQNAV